MRSNELELALFAATLLGALGCAHAGPSSTVGEPAVELISLASGTIVTFDPAAPEVEALAVGEGRVLATGSRAQLLAAYPNARTHELAGAVILPGIIDAHVHVRELGSNALRVDVQGCLDVECMVERLRAAELPEPGAWIVGQGWDEGRWASQGYPDRALLDAAFPEHPVALFSLHGFAGLVNAAALARAGIDASTPDPEGGTILRDAQGRATGVLLTLAQELVRRQIPPPSLAQREAAILRGLELMAAQGVTCVHEAGMAPADVEAFTRLAEAGALPIRVYGMLDGNDDALVAEWLARGPRIDADDRLTIRAFKLFYDGSLGSRTALLTEPYADAPAAARPTERISIAEIEALALAARERGFQLAIHAIGDEANARILDLVARVFGDAPTVDHRWRLEHAQVMAAGDFERAARLRVIASMQPSHAVGDSAWAEDRLGPERAQRAYAWRSFLAAGARLVLSSDLPGEPWTPMQTLYFAVTRARLDGGPAWMQEQALTVDEALRGMTVEGAYAGFAEDRLGALEPGAWADFVVLDADPRAVEAAKLAEIDVRETWVAGSLVAGSLLAGGER